MDTITHFALGACVGELAAGKKLGKKALMIGGIAQLIPDIDVMFAVWMDPASNALAHRGFTHSFLFGVLITFAVGWGFYKWWRDKSIPFVYWLKFVGLEIFLHVLLDGFNAYGTGWFEPFSHNRVSFNIIFVADPLFSVSLGVATCLLFLVRMNYAKRHYIALFGIGFSTLYLCLCISNKLITDTAARRAFTSQHIYPVKYFTTPTPFNNLLWFVVASDTAGNHVGYRSVLDVDDEINFEFFPRNDSLLTNAVDKEEVDRLIRFSQGFYTVEWKSDTLVFNDLRFGQMLGWKDPRAGFVFHYYLYPSLDNKLVLQRGRFENWNEGGAVALVRRMLGEK
ncbi:MAG TPA: metal-dependent hydrolase [Chryseolinea sp.]|nr:metal-dependent hydrolase [Chryseolinea sp.]